MTNRKFKTRIKEHRVDIKYDRRITALARQYRKEQLQIDFKNSKIIFPSRAYFPSIIRESIDIYLRKDSICNEAASFELSKIWHAMIDKLKKQ